MTEEFDQTEAERLVDRDNPERLRPLLKVAYQGTRGSYSSKWCSRKDLVLLL